MGVQRIEGQDRENEEVKGEITKYQRPKKWASTARKTEQNQARNQKE